MVGRGNHDGIHALGVEDLAEILHRLGRLARLFLGHRRGDGLGPAQIGIGHPSDATVAATDEAVPQVIATSAYADAPEGHFVVGRCGPNRLGIRQDRGPGGQAQSNLLGTVKKRASIERTHGLRLQNKRKEGNGGITRP